MQTVVLTLNTFCDFQETLEISCILEHQHYLRVLYFYHDDHQTVNSSVIVKFNYFSNYFIIQI